MTFNSDAKETIIAAINATVTMREAAIKLDLPFSTFKRYAIELGVYKPAQSLKGKLNISQARKDYYSRVVVPIEDIFAGKHPNFRTRMLKEKLFETGLKERRCEKCGNDEIWCGEKIVLELDHIDGDNTNHQYENLRILCPNCHSQTPTFRGRKTK